MVSDFSMNEMKQFINIYNYPVIITDEKYVVILENKKFTLLEKSDKEEIAKKLLHVSDLSEYVIRKNNKDITFSLISSSISIENKEYFIISFFDISVRKKLIKDLSAKQSLFNSLTEQLPEGIILFDEKIIYTNNTFEKLLGYTEKELHQINLLDLFESNESLLFKELLEKLSSKRKSKLETSLKINKKDSEELWVRLNIKRIKQNDKYLFLAVITDISKEVNKLHELSQLAYYDKLTGIYNRRKFDEMLNIEYKITKRYNRHLSALFFDIDHFKKINDTYGHDIGDDVLSNLSSLVSQQIRETDIFARWGGEEFIVLLPETKSEEAIVVAQEIMDVLESYTFPEVNKVTISIGISSVNGKERVQTFLKRLDNALYKAKKEARNRYIVL